MADTDEKARRTLMRWAGIDPELPYDPAKVELPEPAKARPAAHYTPQAAFSTLSDNRVKVGMLVPNLNQGGGEGWTLELLKTTQASLNWVGLVCKDPVEKTNDYIVQKAAQYVPIQFGLDKVADLASRCDVIVTWMVEDFPTWMGGSKPKLIWVDHFPHTVPYDSVTQYCLRSADSIVGVSEVCTPGVPAGMTSKYKIIYNAIDVDKLVVQRDRATMRALWGVPATAPVAGFYARMALEKRPDAMVRLISSLPTNWHVVMVGDSKPYPDEAAYLARMISQLPADVKARLHQLPADPATGDVMNAYDVLVNPPEVESFGLSMCEALFMGLPVVSTPFGMAKIHPELVYGIKLDDTGANLAAAVLAAKAGGPKLTARTFAATACSPATFGLAWSTLITTAAGLKLNTPLSALPGMAISYAKAQVQHAAAGFPRATPRESERRRAICQTCPFFVDGGCAKCRCPSSGLAQKWAMKAKLCPLMKWGPDEA